jgi:hypothetical protein
MKTTTRTLIITLLAILLSVAGCSDNPTDPFGGSGGSGSGGGGTSGGGGGSPASLFPLIEHAQWTYGVSYTSDGSTEYGSVTLFIDNIDANGVALVTVSGQRSYGGTQRLEPWFLLRQNGDRLERGYTTSGPWRTVLESGAAGWSGGSLLLCGRLNAMNLEANLSPVTVAAGTFDAVYVHDEVDNWGEQYVQERYENRWGEHIDPAVGLIKGETYSYYHDFNTYAGPPTTSSLKLQLFSYDLSGDATGGGGGEEEGW